LIAFPILLCATYLQSRKIIGISAIGLIASVWPGMLAASFMAIIVHLTDLYILLTMWPDISSFVRLPILVATGGVSYIALLWSTSRETFMEVANLLMKRKSPIEATDGETPGDGASDLKTA